MKDLVSQPDRPISGGAGCRAHLRALRSHEHRSARGPREERQHLLRQRASRADRRARGGRLRAGDEASGGRADPLGPGSDERHHGCGQRRARLDPDGGDRRRRAEPLLRQAPASGDQPPRRCRPVRDLPALRQAGVARRPAAPHRRGAGQGVHPRGERAPRTRSRGRADGRVLGRDRRRAVRQGAQQHPLAREAQPRRGGRRADRAEPSRRADAGAVRRRWDRRRGCGIRARGVRRAPVAARRAQPHGQGRTPRRQPARARDDGVLGYGVRQRDDPDRGLDPRPRHAVRRGGLELLVRRVHVRHPGHEAHADRHRSRRAGPELPPRDRRARGSQVRADRARPGRPPAGSVGSRSAPNSSRRSRRTARP